MPAFTWYFQVKDREEPGDIVVPVPETYAPKGRVVVATRDAMALVAYLQSLKQPKLDLKMLGMEEAPAPPGAPAAAQAGGVDGAQVYSANCARCHQPDGAGLAGIAPPMRGDAVVLDRNPSEHIRTVIFGAAGRVISGKEYAGKMPAFGDLLTDEEIAAVINHERTSWGNNAPKVTAEDVRKERAK